MNQPDKVTPKTEPVSTVTKHIKIYSDNPIHDCIDRIIDACAGLDEDNAHNFYNAMYLHMATAELSHLAMARLILESKKIERKSDDIKPD